MQGLITVADVNTIWRSKPFQALSPISPVIGLAPMDPIAAWRGFRSPLRRLPQGRDLAGFSRVPVLMRPGWASSGAKRSCRRLVRVGLRIAAQRGKTVRGFFVTSPHYLPMRAALDRRVPLYYYCSDDYETYSGWGGEEIKKKEAALVCLADHSFFVSRVLADRAMQEYGALNEQVTVSPNATDQDFLDEVSAETIADLLANYPAIRRPIVGVIGGINGRLDFDLLRACASHSALGTLLLVGPIDPCLVTERSWQELRRNPRCVVVGARPHEELPVWMHAVDVALIPYRRTPLNHACSPMRLFDHLASGKRIVATDACDQVHGFQQFVWMGESTEAVTERVAAALGESRSASDREAQCTLAAEHTWQRRAATLAARIAP